MQTLKKYQPGQRRDLQTREDLNQFFTGNVSTANRLKIIGYTPLPLVPPSPVPPSPLFIEVFNGETIETLPGVLYTQNLVFINDFNGETIETLPGVLYTQL